VCTSVNHSPRPNLKPFWAVYRRLHSEQALCSDQVIENTCGSPTSGREYSLRPHGEAHPANTPQTVVPATRFRCWGWECGTRSLGIVIRKQKGAPVWGLLRYCREL